MRLVAISIAAHRLGSPLSVRNGQCHCNSQTLSISCCSSNVIINLLWRQTQETNLGGGGQLWHWLPTGVYELGSHLGGTVEVTGARWTWMWDNWRRLHLGLLQSKCQRNGVFHYFLVLCWKREPAFFPLTHSSPDPSVPIAWNPSLYSWNPETKVTF